METSVETLVSVQTVKWITVLFLFRIHLFRTSVLESSKQKTKI